MKFFAAVIGAALIMVCSPGCSSLYKFLNPPEKAKSKKTAVQKEPTEDNLPGTSLAPDLNEYERDYLNQYYKDVDKNRQKNQKNVFKLF